MRILYGVQATGNGHITRARVMAPALAAQGIEVDYLFSGRNPDQLFNMEPFGHYQTRQGLTFVQQGGRVQLWETLRSNNLPRCIADAMKLNLSGYDLVITDFEPVTAWAAKHRGVPSVGIAHQYALMHRLPGNHSHRLMAALIQLFAPVKTAIGVHWHHFDQAILPPLIQPPLFVPEYQNDKVLVYLPTDTLELLRERLQPFQSNRFYIYAGIESPIDEGHLHFRPFSREGFQRDLASCSGVITNSGFGLCSEAMQYGKKILSTPLKNQTEQFSNARCLEFLGRGTVMPEYSADCLKQWLEMPEPTAQRWPDVASVLAAWIAAGCRETAEGLAQGIWGQDPCAVETEIPQSESR
ncbi:MJ1255/VC2487 family glycosyltransferase [Marinobacterium jannaschii]|uniref:MJ1255/VC2487 family glycosyltransferase n=1 Tax=Marinobacterium jannaschii TaxID=64970 RepID=UPI000486EC45|nr:MJ1255/VC2487 family glycosyltransferase [Marinobacterium jannaschii]